MSMETFMSQKTWDYPAVWTAMKIVWSELHYFPFDLAVRDCYRSSADAQWLSTVTWASIVPHSHIPGGRNQRLGAIFTSSALRWHKAAKNAASILQTWIWTPVLQTCPGCWLQLPGQSECRVAQQQLPFQLPLCKHSPCEITEVKPPSIPKLHGSQRGL